MLLLGPATLILDHPLHIDNELRKRFATGDVSAFEQLYEEFAPRVFNTVMLYTNDQHLAEDVVQLVFISCWEKRESFVDVRSLNDFLFIVARNRIYDELKKLANQRKLLQQYRHLHESNIPSIEERMQDKHYEELMQQAIAQLSPQQQVIYQLRQQRLSYEAIAEQLQLSKLTVKKHLELSRKTIREYLQGHLPDDLLITGCLIAIFGII